MKYKIHELSAKAIIRYALEASDCVYIYNLSEDATNKCISFSAPQVQDDCALTHGLSSPDTADKTYRRALEKMRKVLKEK